MATYLPSTPNSSTKYVFYIWQPNPNPWLQFVPVEWYPYFDTYKRNQPQVRLDNNNFDQIFKVHRHKRRAMDTLERKREDKHLRQERFMGPPGLEPSLSGNYESASLFLIEIRKYLNLEADALPSKTPSMIPMLVEKAAEGIINEAKYVRKERKGEKLANLLRQKKHAGIEEVWKQCAYIYTLKSFLYKELNATMKLIGDKEQEQVWRSKVPTLGPFCLLLWDHPFRKQVTKTMTLYRGADLKTAEITRYEEMAKDKDRHQSFQGYISCTRNRKKAKALGNTLFIMEVLDGFIMDLSPYSQYPNEEEELITPGVCFRVTSVEFDRKKNRYLINFELRQGFPSK